MGTRQQLRIEPLESRHLLSGSSILSHLLASQPVAPPPAQGPAPPAQGPALPAGFATPQVAIVPATAPLSTGPAVSLRQFIPGSADTITNRWDWLAQTSWYVPNANLLAYATDQALSGHVPVSDQTLWYVNQAVNGHIQGETVVTLAGSPPSHMTFTGVVTDGGQVRMEFSSGGGQPTTGIGQMRYVEGAWMVQMQMASGAASIVTHWAYMAQLAPGSTPADPISTPPDPSLLSNGWSWLQGTHWAITDSAMFGSATAGVFTIDGFRGGYFWGSGTSTQPFNVFGSVTPEGNLLLMVSVNGAQPAIRTGILQQTSTGGLMTLRTYEGQPAIGSAWTIAAASASTTGPNIPSLRSLIGSR